MLPVAKRKASGATSLDSPAPAPVGTILTALDFIPQGDGTYKAIPRKPVERASVAVAARMSGLGRDVVYRLYHARFIAGTQASPRKILIDVASLFCHLDAARDPEFWTKERTLRFHAGVPY